MQGRNLDNSYGRTNYMDYWYFSDEKKAQLTKKLPEELPALRGTVKALQDKIIVNTIGLSRQTYCAIETKSEKCLGTIIWYYFCSLITIRIGYRNRRCWFSM